ncbi:MAG: YabP/YqfC family sporulation protein [Lachnospiraceae bacterium]|nr:YabP/YqfC family sporulation protein [Lachnospiraceae bacterium]
MRKTGNNTDKIQQKTKLLETLQLPRDVCLGAMRVTLTGCAEAWVENYRGLLEYSRQSILLQGKNGQVCFEGEQLSIDYYTNEDMKISGRIQCVRYL